MNVTDASLQTVDAHWAVQAAGENIRLLALRMADARLAKQALGEQIQFSFPDGMGDDDQLRKVALAYEMAAIEGLPYLQNPSDQTKVLREQCSAGAYRTFEIRRLFPLPDRTEERVFHILHLAALAYCGDRWPDLRRWFNENSQAIVIPSVADAPWDRRLLYRLFECWVRLLRKNSWDDLDQIREIIAGLREDQKTYESGVLHEGTEAADRTMAFRLIGLYHWAKGTELLARYMLQGEPADIPSLLDKHFESAVEAASASCDPQMEVMLRWLLATGRQMVNGSIWWASRSVNSRVSRFVKSVTKQQALFELLPPQRAALLEQGLMDQAATAVVVDMPTSGGKTLLAQFRILQALNQFDADKGWVAYVAPTRALTAQITRRLRRDFQPIGIQVEQLTGAVEVDAFEEELLNEKTTGNAFNILVATPEKLQLVIRNKKVSRPLALVVMDEAHNIESETRGLRIELLLATIKRDCPTANFLLLMPYVEKAETLAQWLAEDIHAGRAISFSTTPWKPNERIVGTFRVETDNSQRSGWKLMFDTITGTPKAMHLEGSHQVGESCPLDVTRSKLLNVKSNLQTGLALQTVGMATVLSRRGTSIAVANSIPSVWSMAREAAKVLPTLAPLPSEVTLVQDFLRTEVSPQFELIGMLAHGVGVHHAGLSDETRTLMEWLAEEGRLKILCATSTIAQGINFPVSSVFLASRFVPQGRQSVEMHPREFWNLAGRAGRMNHDSIGVIGIADGNKRTDIMQYISKATGALASRLVILLDELEQGKQLGNLEQVIQGEQWDDFRCYVAHLWAEKKRLDAVLAETEQLLRNTYGYTTLRTTPAGKAKAEALLNATKAYARKLADNPGLADLADSTGFSPEGVQKALIGINQLENKLALSDWSPEGLFGNAGGMADLFGVMLRVPQISAALREIGGEGTDHQQLANITKDWVNGKSLQEIATSYFSEGEDPTKAFTDACRAIYRTIVNNGTWGLSALSRLSGMNFEKMSAEEKRRINTLPAMIYHGVRTEEAVLMRMNSAPRSVAEPLGEAFKRKSGQGDGHLSVQSARNFIKSMDVADWDRVRPKKAALSGTGFKKIWGVLSGEGS
ncbi:MAG: DEAD/DEAH box helicase [Magnetococcales bacterium]|nr:DEAD/DEAH box helicase [Magnetococcales bacterium]